MAIITATFPSLTFSQRGVQTREVFVQTQEAGQDVLSGSWATAAALFKTETNDVRNEVNTLRNDTEGFKNTAVTQAGLATQQVGFAEAQVVLAQEQVTLATTKTNEASASAASALASKNAIEAMVIPTEATYNYAHIDSASNIRDLENFLDFNF